MISRTRGAPPVGPPVHAATAMATAPRHRSGSPRRRRSIGAPQFSIRRMEIDNVSVSYADREAVKSVSLPVRQGEVLAMIGPSGCGKTTLLRSLNRLTELTRTAKLTRRDPARRRRHHPDRADPAAAPSDDGLPAAEPVPDERLRQHRLRAARAGLAAPSARRRSSRRSTAPCSGPASSRRSRTTSTTRR